jgi:beta-galactosidase
VRRTSFNDGWTVRPKPDRFAERFGESPEWTPVTLPHDAMIGTARSPDARAASAYFPDGTWQYERMLERADDGPDAVVLLEFEGVYRDAVVSVNGTVAAHRPYGYSNFCVPIDHLLTPGAANELRVEVRAGNDTRWYSGAGIYRNVWLLESGRVHLAPDGLQVRTPEIDDHRATLAVAAVVRNQSAAPCTATLRFEVQDADGAVVACTDTPVTTFPGDTITVRSRLSIASPRRWGPDDPYLYACRAVLRVDDEIVDDERTTFGVRSLSLDTERGLRINGESILLRGACVHHDNGVLGAATIARAEVRRVELLQAAGFNAIRSAHNPMSRAMLDACDRLGMLVMDETFDMWAQSKSEDDYALRFPDWWEADVEAMVRKDVNYPSVILYSIGNEIPDGSTPTGVHVGRALAEKVRSLDDSRFVTQAISGLVVGGSELFAEFREGATGENTGESTGANTGENRGTSTGVSTAITNLADAMSSVTTSPVVARMTQEAFSYLDVAGYNYMETRFELDRELFPHRAIAATESHPQVADACWAGVVDNPNVIGDFTWTGWDYLGEAGIGRVEYGTERPPLGMGAFLGDYPWLAAWCGDIDITGRRRPQSYYREIVFGRRTNPYIAVQRPQHHGLVLAHASAWSWSDVVASWTWAGHVGAPVVVEVYADADEVELVLDAQSLGRAPAGADHRFRAEFETTYRPGLLVAVARRGGEEIGRASLRSASGPVLLDARADRAEISADAADVAFVELTLLDESGSLYNSADRKITVDVAGPGVLQGLGSANPRSEESFTDAVCTTFDGRALAVIRPTGEGAITVTASAEGCEPQPVRIHARG